jgi:hypothetical protein
MNIKMISCITCKEDMPELRFTQYNYAFCVKCSELGLGSKPQKAITMLMGEGDHTWVETIIMSETNYNSHVTNEEKNFKNKKIKKKDNDIEDDRNIQGPFKVFKPKN